MEQRLWRTGRMGLVLAFTLAACGQKPPPPLPPVVYDGQFSGSIHLTGVASGADKSWCEASPQFSVDIAQNAFTFTQQHPQTPNGVGVSTYLVTVARDGTFQGESNSTGLLTGKIDGAQMVGAQMTGNVDGIGCAYQFTATRR